MGTTDGIKVIGLGHHTLGLAGSGLVTTDGGSTAVIGTGIVAGLNTTTAGTGIVIETVIATAAVPDGTRPPDPPDSEVRKGYAGNVEASQRHHLVDVRPFFDLKAPRKGRL